MQAASIDVLAGKRQPPDQAAEARIRELERALWTQDAGGRDLGVSVAAGGLRQRARIGRELTAEHPQTYPKATVARLLRISRQSLYHRPPASPSSPSRVVSWYAGRGGTRGRR